MLWWDEKLATGIEKIDNQHREIFNRVGEIFLLNTQCDKAKIQESLVFLLDYVKKHFSDEEKAMLDSGYVDIDTHRKQHNYFADGVFKINQEIQKENVNENSLDGLKLLVIEWLARHISEDDKAFVEYLKERQA